MKLQERDTAAILAVEVEPSKQKASAHPIKATQRPPIPRTELIANLCSRTKNPFNRFLSTKQTKKR